MKESICKECNMSPTNQKFVNNGSMCSRCEEWTCMHCLDEHTFYCDYCNLRYCEHCDCHCPKEIPETSIFTVTMGDLNSIAVEVLDRELTDTEMNIVIKNFQNGINWDEVAENAIRSLNLLKEE